MATDPMSNPTAAATVAGLLVAGLGVAFAYIQLGAGPKSAHAHTRARVRTAAARLSADGDTDAKNDGAMSGATVTRKGRKKKKGRGRDVGTGEDETGAEGEGESERKDRSSRGAAVAVAVSFPQIVPGNFEGVGAPVGSQEGSDAETASKRENGGKAKTNSKKRKQGMGKGKRGDGGKEEKKKKKGEEEAEEEEEGVNVGRTATHGLRSGDSTDASVSLSPSVPASALASSRAVGKGSLRARTRLAPLSQPHSQTSARTHTPSHPREIRPSLSLDTDSSWTHVDHYRPKTSGSTDELARGLTDAMDVTSSDLASTASESPVARQMDNNTTDMHGARADLVQRTLAEKLLPRPRETSIDDMLEDSDYPTLARVMRVQPPADETPIPGFSWEDYGDVVEESLLVDDADQEDEGEWGVVKGRHRTRPPQTTTSMSTSTSHVSAAPENMTKKQRQNARKRALDKSVRAEAEVARREGLAKHQRELERLRIIEQSQRGGGKRPSGGMQAAVDDQGKLVWE